jgi:uncharacterized membrane protein YdjX (TVP38/TMEM64 family)
MTASSLKRFAPLLLVALALIAFFVFDGPRYISLETLRTNRAALSDFVSAHPFAAPLAFVALYAGLVAISFPGASLLTIFGGFLFGTWAGGSLVVIAATLGAVAIFTIARTALGEGLAAKAGPWLAKFEAGFKENAFSYLFILRLVPAFPFWLVNIAPALLNVKLRDYAIATALGIVPGTFVYASVGAGAGAVLDAGGDLKLSGLLLKPEILGPIAGLVALALIPILYKKLKKHG